MAEDLVLENGLYLIGTGVGSALNMSIGGQRIAAACEHRFLEGYTSLLDSDENIRLETIVGTYSVIRRPAVENPDTLLSLAKTSSVALMVIGDPLQATTHVDLLLRCKDEQIHAEVHHAVSIVELVCAGIGLQSYKFGRQVTIPFPYSGHVPTSPLEFLIFFDILSNIAFKYLVCPTSIKKFEAFKYSFIIIFEDIFGLYKNSNIALLTIT